MYDYHQVTRVAPENASHEYQLSHHEWWDSWYECDAFSGATRVEPDGNHITTVAYVAMITGSQWMLHWIFFFDDFLSKIREIAA